MNLIHRVYATRMTAGTAYAPWHAAPQRQQLVNCGSICSPHPRQVQDGPVGTVLALASARSAAVSSVSSTNSCGQVSSMGRSPKAPARYWLRSSESMPAAISTLRACATCNSDAALNTRFTSVLISMTSKTRPHPRLAPSPPPRQSPPQHRPHAAPGEPLVARNECRNPRTPARWIDFSPDPCNPTRP